MVVQFICCVGGVFTRAGLDGVAAPSSLPHISFSSRTFYPTILQIASPILSPFAQCGHAPENGTGRIVFFMFPINYSA